jgi:hypothetical protein
MRRPLLCASILVFLLVAILSISLSTVVIANPVGMVFQEKEISPTAVNAQPPQIMFQSPTVNATCGATVLLRCNITGGAFQSNETAWISSLSYKGDWEQAGTAVQFRGAWGIDKLYVKGDLTYFSTNLTVPEGKHSITVWATEGGSYEQDTGQKFKGAEIVTIYTFHLSASQTVDFMVDSRSPTISVIAKENTTYTTSDVPLVFNVNESEANFTYCLDGQPASPVVGNSTLSNLPNGCHSIVVYATDKAGNVGVSEPVVFTVDASPFQTLQASEAIAIIVVVVITLIILFFKSRKSKPIS